MSRKNGVTEIGPATNGGQSVIESGQPYTATVIIVGTADMLFHRWNVEAVAEKSAAAKGSKSKKSDDIESYVYRDDGGHICLPSEYLRQAVIAAAKYRQDPRSPRKSASDLYKAGVVCLTVMGNVMRDGKPMKAWDYEHKCRCQVQRNGITRTRPAIKEGWEATLQFCVLLPEYIKPNDLQDVLTNAGKLVGVADFRPTYGRFMIKSFDIGLE